jgi:hypothetical protein
MATSVAEFPSFTIAIDAALTESAVESIARGPCRLMAVRINNNHSEVNYLKFWDLLSPTVGTDAPVEQYKMPAHNSADKEDNIPINPPNGLLFSTALSMAATLSAGSTTSDTPGGTVGVSLLIVPEEN